MNDIPVKPIQSQSIKAIGHDPKRNVLAVQFHGSGTPRTYHYHGVSAAQHLALVAAPSSGSHFARHIKGRFPSVHVA